MAEMDKQEFKFPDEQDDTQGKPEVKIELEGNDLEIEIEDDTPEEDRNRTPSDPEKVKQLEVEVDDLDKYSKEAKDKIIKMKRVWHDERRAKEAALREQQEAVRVAQQLLEENKKLKEAYSTGEKTYIEVAQGAAESGLQLAKRNYKEALDSGDSDAIADAQIALNEATYKAQQAKNFRPTTLQVEEKDVQIPQKIGRAHV